MTARDAFRRFSPALASEGPRFALAAALLLIATGCEIVGIFVLSDVIDGALTATSLTQFGALAVLWLLVTAVATAATCSPTSNASIQSSTAGSVSGTSSRGTPGIWRPSSIWWVPD
jgi:ABC-type multidrug transport system fused ATPase/permease subunit